LKILALDTSTEACSVAVVIDGAVYECFELVQQQHSARILPMVQEVLAQAELALTHLDVLAFGRGPGSFTGLRIGAGVIQGLAFGADLPVAPVSSLAALAQGQQAERVLAALDARMAQVYWGAYIRNSEGIMELSGQEVVAAPQEVPLPDGDSWVGAGSGWDCCGDKLSARVGGHLASPPWQPYCYPRARHVAQIGAVAFKLGQAVTAENAVPTYLRNEVAKKQKA
jgi:tRNA threonylcarbamoyladenosine biosynthesis protein TsaB